MMKKVDYRYPALLLLLAGLGLLGGGVLGGGSVLPSSLLSWVVGLGVLVYAIFLFVQSRRIGEELGYQREIESEKIPLKILRIVVFLLLGVVISYLFPPLSIIFLLFLLYPVAVSLDDVGEMDNIMSGLDVWRRNPILFLEFLLVSSVLLLTAAFLEAVGGTAGAFLSLVLTSLFTIPFLTNLLVIYYLSRYPLALRHLSP